MLPVSEDSSVAEEMDEVYRKLQIYLMKKDRECGQLRFLTSRTTTENFNNVQDVCDAINDILEGCGVATRDDVSTSDRKCARAFKYLLLNTSFRSQEHLAEDPTNGHLVDMCPPLSPYLLAEVLWSLRYEEIAAESILHAPLDVAVELIELSKRCLNLLDFDRRLNFLSLLTLNSYKILRLIDENGALTTSVDESPEKLMIYFQELMALYFDPNFTRMNEVAGLKKSERDGLILKKLLDLTRKCLDCAKNGVKSSPNEAFYKITYGREPHKRMNENFVTQLGMLDHEFVHNLLKKLTNIDVKTYIDWVSLEDSSVVGMNLQKSIGIDCHNFIEFIENYGNLIKLESLIECLKQLASKPDILEARGRLDLDALLKDVQDERAGSLKELLKRHSEWNHETFAVVRKYRSCLDKDDFFHLLEYLTRLMTRNGQEEHKREVYATVTKVLLGLDVKNVYETTVNYILKYDGCNTLESARTGDTFKKFMSRNKNFKSSGNFRLVLFFLVKNPRKILSMLVKMAIGHPEYENIMVTPGDLMLVSPIMNIREKPNETLIIAALRDIFVDGEEWNKKKFLHLVRFMIDECVFTADDIVNKAFVPSLAEGKVDPSNLVSVLNCLRQIVAKCTEETRYQDLVVAIAREMSRIRGETKLKKYYVGQTLGLMTRIIDISSRKMEIPAEARDEFIDRLEKSVCPIDRHHFAKFLLSDPIANIDINDTIRDYEGRCLTILTRIRNCRDIVEDEKTFEISNFDHNRFVDDYIRHVIVLSMENEYVKFAIETTIFQWQTFHCLDEYEAYEKIVRLTIEACAFCLEFPRSNPPDAFAALLKSLARFTRTLVNVESIREAKKILDSLNKHFFKLNKSVERTTFSSLYASTLVEINNIDEVGIDGELDELVTLIDKLANGCLDISHADANFDGEPSNEAKRYKISHDFVTEITRSDHADENNAALRKIYQLLSSQRENY